MMPRFPPWLGGVLGLGAGALAFLALLLPWLEVTGPFLTQDRNALQLGSNLSPDGNGIAFLAVAGAWVVWGGWDCIRLRPSAWRWAFVRAAAMATALVGMYSALTSFPVPSGFIDSVSGGYYLAWAAVVVQVAAGVVEGASIAQVYGL